MEKTYDPHAIEQRWYQYWEENACFEPRGGESSYCIMLPPPNVTGSLHMGHAFNNTLQDILVRWHRMRGFDTLWQPGTDHAGIATQMVVERELAKEGLSRLDLGREAFVERLRAILAGEEQSTASEAVAVNAAAALYVAGVVDDLRSGLETSREVLRSASSVAILETLAQRSKELAEHG